MPTPPATAKSARQGARKRVLTEQRRSAIIAAALNVFAAKGFHHSRAEDVAAQARIAKGTLYLYFESKDAIYEAALQHAITRLQALVEERLQHATSLQERIRAFINARLAFWGDHGELYRMILTLGREKKHRKQTEAILTSSTERLNSILEEAIARGELNPRSLQPIAWAVMDLIRGANERRMDGRSVLSAEEETTFITETVLRYFQAGEAGSRQESD